MTFDQKVINQFVYDVCFGSISTGATAIDRRAGARAAGDGHGQVVVINHRDEVKVHAATGDADADVELGQRPRRLPGGGARERASAVNAVVVPASAVEGASRAAPDLAAAIAARHVEWPRLVLVELRAAAYQDGRRSTVKAQLLIMLNVAALALATKVTRTRRKRTEDTDADAIAWCRR
jgi:hypothetical protein